MGESNLKQTHEFSYKTREKSLQRFQEEVFDLLIIGGGITGAAVARDAVSRGLRVALVERRDFAYGTSSRSSKLIHGGLRYLQNFEFGLVFEALAERSLLLKTAPHLVRPLPFYLPVYQGDPHGKGLLNLGLWLYDLLALFRSPGFHRKLSKKNFLAAFPFLNPKGLVGGFRYFDASMWDDVLAIETLRSACWGGAAVANYVEAVSPIWENEHIVGFQVRDLEKGFMGEFQKNEAIQLRAHRTVICTGPWTDQMGLRLTRDWKRWLTPSKGVHLLFDLKRIPVPGAMVMSSEDGRIAFVIPRPDYGSGVVIVGTTDGSTSDDPDEAKIKATDVSYLMKLLNRYFPDLHLTQSDILSGYVGVRPLMGGESNSTSGGQSSVLQKVSREHHIDQGPGGTVLVAGGKYTTHRKMAEEIVDFVLKVWRAEVAVGKTKNRPPGLKKSNTRTPLNPATTPEALLIAKSKAIQLKLDIPLSLLQRYGDEVFGLVGSNSKSSSPADPEGFPYLKEQFRFALKNEMVIHLEDFYLRRIPLYSTRKDHGIPWSEKLAEIWAEERGQSHEDVQKELVRLNEEFEKRSDWMNHKPSN